MFEYITRILMVLIMFPALLAMTGIWGPVSFYGDLIVGFSAFYIGAILAKIFTKLNL